MRTPSRSSASGAAVGLAEGSAMTVISPDLTRFSRPASTHGLSPLVVRELPVLPKPGQALGLTW